MILGIGTRRINGSILKRTTAAFSLIEIVLVLALVALATSVVLFNFDAFIGRGKTPTARESLNESIRYARIEAAKTQAITEIHFDKESGSLIVSTQSQTLKSFDLGESFKASGFASIRFDLIPPAEGFAPFEPPADQKNPLERVQFSPDRSSTPFLATIDDGINPPISIAFDPFSHFPRQEPQ